ncbi:MAG TPA: methyltransferase domain-containing protein [Candidatus Binatia bacterium]|nr:methyltransferase domain-containing protein [Candidatus Binatia bacterium]
MASGVAGCYQGAMSPLVATGPNAEQITYWNEVYAPKWLRFQQVLDQQLGALGRMAMERAAIHPGERVLDVGCGCGNTTLELARRVGREGSVVGIDVSTPMLDRALESARAAEIANVAFWNADAQMHPLPPAAFDLVYSRFGVMFFVDPAKAFTNLGRALRPGGRVCFVCWQALERNPWMAVPMAAAAREITLPSRPGPEAPGPFSFADPDRVRRILVEAGLTDVTLEGCETMLGIGGTGALNDGVEFLVEMGPIGAALRDAGASFRPRVVEAVKQAIAPFHGPQGLRMPSAVWLVHARRQ